MMCQIFYSASDTVKAGHLLEMQLRLPMSSDSFIQRLIGKRKERHKAEGGGGFLLFVLVSISNTVIISRSINIDNIPAADGQHCCSLLAACRWLCLAQFMGFVFVFFLKSKLCTAPVIYAVATVGPLIAWSVGGDRRSSPSARFGSYYGRLRSGESVVGATCGLCVASSLKWGMV